MKEVTQCPACDGTNFSAQAETKDFTITQQTFRIVKCTNCGLGITSPRPADEELGRFYLSTEYISHVEKPTTLFDSIYHIARNYTLRWKYNLLRKLTSGLDVLDFGCGAGDFLAFLQQRGYRVIGVEPSTSARELTVKKIGRQQVFDGLHLVDNQLDVVTLWHVLEHIPNLNETLVQLKSRLKPNGFLIIAVPNLNSWDSNYYKSLWAAYDTPRHLWHFSKGSMLSLLGRHNLKVAQVLPMRLDAFYVSLLSEKYRRNRKHSLGGTINALLNGLRSNLSAKKTSEYSSLIYIVQNEDH